MPLLKLPLLHVKLCAGVILWLSFPLRLRSAVNSFQSKGSPRIRPQGP